MTGSRAASLLLLMPSLAVAQPLILTPDEPKPAIPKPTAISLPREGLIEVPLNEPAMTGTAVGGYGEIVLNAPFGDVPADRDGTTADVRRVVLYFGHNFTERLRLYTEVEIEHAVAADGDQGEVAMEQAFLDYLGWRWLNFRAGLIVMPVGIVNIYHEPPTFNGVDRPDTDLRIIPSTWREIGAGGFGAVGPLRYQAYVVTGFNAKGFTNEGLREGHQEGMLARAHDWGVVARLDYQPLEWVTAGASFYHCNSAQNDPALTNPTNGDPQTDVPVTLFEIDARASWRGIHARAEFANVWIYGTRTLNDLVYPVAMDEEGPVPKQVRGGYIELGYNVLRPFHLASNPTLVAFGRYERTDTQAEVLDRTAAADKDRTVLTFGLTFRPIAEVAVKFDYQRRIEETHSWNAINLGLGFMY